MKKCCVIAEQIEEYAKSLGFDLVGFTKAKIEDKHITAFANWLKEGNHGQMQYMEKLSQRKNLDEILPGAKTVICLATNYYRSQKPLSKNAGRVARYAYGRDYHKIISKKLKQIITYLNEIAPEHQHKAYVDTGPVLERALAEQAGIGIIGKNSCLITKEYGSWVFLSEIFTTLEISGQPEKKTYWQPDRDFKVCGNCTKCIDSCPTGAIIAPGVIDSRLCISYLTIENKDHIPSHLAKIIAKTKRIYGCDICQEVCPHNQAREKENTQFQTPKIAGDELKKAPTTDENFLKTFAGSPLMRVKRKGLQRNLKTLS